MARGSSAAAAERLPRAAAAPARSAPAPRRRSGPATPAARRLRVAVPAAPSPTALLDSLLRGRAWVLCVGGLLAGIVFFNVSLLELNAGIARTGERAGVLKRQNATLRTEVAELGSSERIQETAAARGFVLPAPGEVEYLRVDPAHDAVRAAKTMTEPRPEPVVEPAPLAPTTAPAAPTTAPLAPTTAPAAPTTAPAAPTPAVPAPASPPEG